MPGAIWGVVSNVTPVDPESIYTFDTFKDLYRMKHFEAYETQDACLRAATINLKHPEQSDNPIYINEDTGCVVIADVILDNRDDLIKQIGFNNCLKVALSDSEIIYHAYIKWGHDCADYLLGDFAFAVIDKHKVFCARDPMGIRTLYYRYDKGQFWFGTLLKSVMHQKDKMPEINEAWMVDFLSLTGVLHQIRDNETVYEGICFLEPGHTLCLTNGKLHKKRYWWPEGKYETFTDQKAAYEAVKDTFKKAVACRTEVDGPIGVLLSGGLDSTSVAAVACKLGNTRGQLIHGFTSIPEFDIKTKNLDLVTDESTYVDALCELYPNLISHKEKCEGQNAFDISSDLVNILEIPYKFIENSHWVYPILDQVEASGCCVLLTGSYGNGYYSSGMRRDTMMMHLIRFRLKAFKEFWKYYEGVGFSKKQLRKRVIHDLIPRDLKAFYRKVRRGEINQFQGSFVKSELIKKHDVDIRIHNALCNTIPINPYSKKKNQLILSPFVLNHMNELEVKTGLAKGIIVRDPTIDKRLVEVISAVPYDFLCDPQMDRKLPRIAMAEYLPEVIRLNMDKKGFQGADWVKRLEPRIMELKELIETFIAMSDSKVIDLQKVKAYVASIDFNQLSAHEASNLMQLYVTFKFDSMNNLRRGKCDEKSLA